MKRSIPVGAWLAQVSKISARLAEITERIGIAPAERYGRPPTIYRHAHRRSVPALWARVDAALKTDPVKTDVQHAKDLRCCSDVIARRRKVLGLRKSNPSILSLLRLVERASDSERRAIAKAVWARWPHMVKNAIEEEREEAVVLQ